MFVSPGPVILMYCLLVCFYNASANSLHHDENTLIREGKVKQNKNIQNQKARQLTHPKSLLLTLPDITILTLFLVWVYELCQVVMSVSVCVKEF